MTNIKQNKTSIYQLLTHDMQATTTMTQPTNNN